MTALIPVKWARGRILHGPTVTQDQCPEDYANGERLNMCVHVQFMQFIKHNLGQGRLITRELIHSYLAIVHFSVSRCMQMLSWLSEYNWRSASQAMLCSAAHFP